MPTLTGSVADVTGVALAPGQIRQVFVKAPGERPSLADGGVLIVSAPVHLGSSGSLSVALEPGPAVLTVDTFAGGPDVYDLYVTADMTLLSEAIDEAAPERDRLWAESVMVQLRDEAVAAAARAEQAAEDVDAAIAGAADQVVQAVEGDRILAEAARTGAEAARSDAAWHRDTAMGYRDEAQTAQGAAAGSATAAASSASAAAGSASAADSSAGTATTQAGVASSAAGTATTRAGEAAGSASAAAGSATAAAGFADDAELWATSFGLTATSTTGAPGTNASVTVTGSGPEYGLAFTVPRGDKGPKGDPGEVSTTQLNTALAGKADLVGGKVPGSQLPALGAPGVVVTNNSGSPRPDPVAGNSSISVGYGATSSSGATAVGGYANASGADASAFGSNSTAAGPLSWAGGSGAYASGEASLAIGAGAASTHDGSTAIGVGANTTTGGQVMIGHSFNKVHIPGTLALASPDGSMWAINVSNTGAITATALP